MIFYDYLQYFILPWRKLYEDDIRKANDFPFGKRSIFLEGFPYRIPGNDSKFS